MLLHPIFVHYPIAFFVVYALIEILPLERKFPSLATLKHWLILLAFAGTLLALTTGYLDARFISENSTLDKLLNAHATVGIIFTVLTAIISAGFIVMKYQNKILASSFKYKEWLVKVVWLRNKVVAITLAAIGLLLVFVQGALGGLMVYGPTLDPITNVIFKIVTGL